MSLSSNELSSPQFPSDFRNGGSRAPRYGTPSAHIHSRLADPYERAVQRATAANLAFVFVTVTWNLTSRAPESDLKSVVWLRQAVRKWLHRKMVKFYDLGVRELAPVKGAHWHWLIHCPPELRGDGAGELYHYIRGLLAPLRAGAVHIRTPPRPSVCEGCGRQRTWQHLALCYFLKGAEEAVRQRNGINACASASLVADETYDRDQGVITGKRLYHSRSLADTAARLAPTKGAQAAPAVARPIQQAGDHHDFH